MARYYDKLCHVGGVCSKCRNRLDVFGEWSESLVTCCRECNVRRAAQDFARTIKSCCKVPWIFRLWPDIVMTLLLEFLDLAPWRLRRSLLLEHNFRLAQLQWLCCPQEWYMIDYDTEEEEAERETLQAHLEDTLGKVY